MAQRSENIVSSVIAARKMDIGNREVDFKGSLALEENVNLDDI